MMHYIIMYLQVMAKHYITASLILIFVALSNGFANIFPINKISLSVPMCYNERMIYGSYLLGLRKTRRLLSSYNATKANELVSILNFTNNFIDNYAKINNTEMRAKTITMHNIVIDVSNIKYIEINTKNDKLIIELDKQDKDAITSIAGKVHNMEALVSVVSILGKITNFT